MLLSLRYALARSHFGPDVRNWGVGLFLILVNDMFVSFAQRRNLNGKVRPWPGAMGTGSPAHYRFRDFTF